MDQERGVEDLIHAEHLKPYFDGKEPEEGDTPTEPEEISTDNQPTLEPEDMATSNPPDQFGQPPAGTDQVRAGASDANQPRGRGRPRKNVQTVNLFKTGIFTLKLDFFFYSIFVHKIK